MPRRLTIEDAHKLAKNNGGKLLSKKYVNQKQLLKWVCDKDHKFNMSYNAVRSGSWCQKCSRYNGALLRRKNIEDIKKIAIERGGELLSKEYVGCNQLLEWCCNKGHIFNMSYRKVKIGQWCSECNIYWRIYI